MGGGNTIPDLQTHTADHPDGCEACPARRFASARRYSAHVESALKDRNGAFFLFNHEDGLDHA